MDVHVAIFTLYFPVGTPHPPLRFSAPLNSHGDQLVCSDVRSSFQNGFSHHTYSAMSRILSVTYTQLHHTYMYSASSHILSVYSATSHILSVTYTQQRHTYSAQRHILSNVTHTQQCHTYSEISHILSNVSQTQKHPTYMYSAM